LKGYSFQKQIDYDEAYGLLPLELLFRLDWEPLEQLKTRFTTVLWSGTKSKTGNNTDVKLQDAADISMGVEYKLNKKWALWIDLNNIANSRYQRWNQYPSFGFNFIGGVRYAFNKKD
jgi:long-subunit fatty acid transport protein